jgi:glycosyltransferase involved in cell wall biosynthesis
MNVTAGPLVSVVIPTYNHANFLGRALQSVLDQTYANWEAIVVDNHSTDNTDNVLGGFIDSRVTVLKIHNNGIIAASRNMGICAAKGDWIAFLDSDDIWYPNKLEIAAAAIRDDPLLDVCSTDEVMVDVTTGAKRLLKYGPYCKDFYKKLLVEGNCLSPSATLVRRDFLNNNSILFRENIDFITAEDYDFWMNLAQAGAKFGFIHSVQGEYYIHSINNSGQIERHSQSVSNVAQDHIFNRQRFDPCVIKLWGRVNARLLLTKARAYARRKQFHSCSYAVGRAFHSSLAGSLWWLVHRAIRSIL